MSKTAKLPENEWSYVIKGEDVPQKGKKIEISPSDSEKIAMARRLDIVSIDELSVEFNVTREVAHILFVQGKFKGKVTQNCVVTLEPIVSDIADEFEAWFADETRAVNFKRAQHDAQSKKEMLEIPMLEESDDPEPMVNGEVDLGELVTQYISLALPAYPCKEGAMVEVGAKQQAETEKNQMKLNPFAALKNWRPKD